MMSIDFVVYLCPNCGDTIKWPAFHYARPNTICKCGEPDFVTQMVMVWPPAQPPLKTYQRVGERVVEVKDD